MTKADAYAAHLKSWAEDISVLSLGRTCAKTLLDAALQAWIEGKDLDDPSLRHALVARATAAPGATS